MIPSVFVYAQIRCADICGFGLYDDQTDLNKDVYLDVTNGNISNTVESELSYKLTVLQSRFMKEAITTRQRSVLALDLNGPELKQLIRHLDVYFKYHIEGYKDRRSDSIFEQMLQAK